MTKTAVEKLSARDDSEVNREHQVLYRKFRPRQFADVVGQDHIINTLQRKIVERKVGHAFLFVGPRGCGKTTTARLLAMASNCENLSSEGEPCGTCATCNSIVSGSGAIGLHELDAASNRGIGEMKALIDTMGQGSVARKKVYIIDEALALDTPIPTPSGWTTMGDIVPGDYVLGTGGYPVKVVRATEIAEGRPCYRVTFSDGTSVVADENHKWMVEPRKGTSGNNVSPARVMTTGEMFIRSSGNQYRLPKVNAIDLPEVELSVDPYLMGRWLGDGSSGQPHITAMTSQVDPLVNELRLMGENVNVIKSGDTETVSRISIGGGDKELFSDRMKALDVFYDKHIPDIYLRASLKQRLALVQGLMDSDGHIVKDGYGNCTFINTNEKIVDGMVEVLRSLGYHPKAKVREDKRVGVKGQHKDLWKVTFRGNPDLMPFRTRHTEYVTVPRKELRKSIVSIESVDSVPVRCIEVDAEDHLFLAGVGMAVTHNCHMLTKEASNALLKTLEEPPADTLIILATTEANKVLDTIQSRATRYNFKLIDAKTMTGLVKDVVDATGMDIGDEGIAEVVRRGHGSPRDTLTALEGYGGDEAGDDVHSFVPAIASALARRDSGALVIGIAEAINSGVDVADLTRTLLSHWRNCLLALEAPGALDLDKKEVDSLAKQAKEIKANRIVRLMNVTAEALGNMNSSGDSRILLETTLLQVSQPTASDSLEGIYDRFDDVFDILDDLTRIVKQNKPASNAVDWPPADKKEKVETVEPAPAPEPVKEEKVIESEPAPEQEESVTEPDEVTSDDTIEEDSDEGAEDEVSHDDEDSEEDHESGDDDESDDDDQWDYDDDNEDDDSDDTEDRDENEDDEPSGDINDLIKSDDEPKRENHDDEESAAEHDHDEDDASGFLECSHPDCVAKLKELKSAEKSAPKKTKAEPEKKDAKAFYDEDKAPTARDLVEIIQHDLIERKYSRYLQDTVMDADIEEEKGKVYLVLTHRKESGRIPTKDALDAIIDCSRNLWVDEIEYIGEER